MTSSDPNRIDFYTRVADPRQFACRLAALVYRSGERLLVWLPDAAALEGFSHRLWSLEDTLFVPHAPLGSPEADDTPIWLTDSLPDNLSHPVLLNLSGRMPARPARFLRILEIVGSDTDSMARARDHYRAYREQGFSIEHHDMSQG